MQAINLSAAEALAGFSPLAETIWLVALADGSVKIIKDTMTKAYEGKVVKYDDISNYYRKWYVYPPDLCRWDDWLSLEALQAMAAQGVQEAQFDIRFKNSVTV